MRVVSGAGEFELTVEQLEARPESLVMIGKMGVWEAQTFIDAADLGRLGRLMLRPRVLAWVLRQPFSALWRRLRGRPGPGPPHGMLGLGLAILLILGCGGADHWRTTIEGGRKPEAVLEAGAAAQRRAGRGVHDTTILFGDLHVHTAYSWDSYLFSLPLVGGEGAHPPADACDFARYCASLDFFALTDHAESLLPEHWAEIKQSVRQCNALAGGGGNPDLVAFTGFEWSHAGLTPETHYGHRCVIFRDTAEDLLPARPISSGNKSRLYRELRGTVGKARWFQPFHWRAYGGYIRYLDALTNRPVCAEDTDTRELPLDCQEIAPDPGVLDAKLDQWGFDALVIPHGTAWGIYTPATASIANHLDPAFYDPKRQRLIEVMSGHGSSEEYRGWREAEILADGTRRCPEPTPDYLPCCWQAGEIMRARCGDLPREECEARVAEARRLAAQAYTRPQQIFPDTEPADWLDCGQCRDCFKPAYGYRPRESVQYAMALSRPDARAGNGALRFRYGFVASSDNHTARPGTGYKQIERSMMTDALGTPGFVLRTLGRLGRRMKDPTRPQAPQPSAVGLSGNDMRISSFLYPGGLAAVHARGRSRQAIWEALERREVYGTSGPRILLWFDLLNGETGRAPMGSEHRMQGVPRFEVRAVGSFEPLPGCPDWGREGLSPARLRRLCRDECYHPGDRRRAITAIEVIRIRPEVPGSDPAAGIEDPWQRFPCPPDPSGCVVRFADPGFPASGRDALYYVRALEEPSPALNGSPLRTRFDGSGNAVAVEPCLGPGSEDGCPAPVQERAWSSPIFLDQPGRPGTAS